MLFSSQISISQRVKSVNAMKHGSSGSRNKGRDECVGPPVNSLILYVGNERSMALFSSR